MHDESFVKKIFLELFNWKFTTLIGQGLIIKFIIQIPRKNQYLLAIAALISAATTCPSRSYKFENTHHFVLPVKYLLGGNGSFYLAALYFKRDISMLSAIKIIFFNDTCIERIFIIIEINNNSLLSNYFKFYISSIMKNTEIHF